MTGYLYKHTLLYCSILQLPLLTLISTFLEAASIMVLWNMALKTGDLRGVMSLYDQSINHYIICLNYTVSLPCWQHELVALEDLVSTHQLQQDNKRILFNFQRKSFKKLVYGVWVCTLHTLNIADVKINKVNCNTNVLDTVFYFSPFQDTVFFQMPSS